MIALGYKQTGVWSFNKEDVPKFSSVTRDFYIGFGPSSGTYTGENFYFNTFSIEDYCRITKQRKPIILRMKVDMRMKKLFWLYWRFYETIIPKEDYKKIFNSDLNDDFGFIFLILKKLGFVKSENDKFIKLNLRGVFYTHLAQNLFALDYVNEIWTSCQKNKNPDKVSL